MQYDEQHDRRENPRHFRDLRGGCRSAASFFSLLLSSRRMPCQVFNDHLLHGTPERPPPSLISAPVGGQMHLSRLPSGHLDDSSR